MAFTNRVLSPAAVTGPRDAASTCLMPAHYLASSVGRWVKQSLLIGTCATPSLSQVRIDAVHNRDVVLLLNMDSNEYQFEQLSLLLLLQRFEAKPCYF